MPTYSVAEAKDNISRMIDEALAGDEVTITRYGAVVAELRPRERKAPRRLTDEEWRRLRHRRADRPPLGADSAALIRAMRDEAP